MCWMPNNVTWSGTDSAVRSRAERLALYQANHALVQLVVRRLYGYLDPDLSAVGETALWEATETWKPIGRRSALGHAGAFDTR